VSRISAPADHHADERRNTTKPAKAANILPYRAACGGIRHKAGIR
jgi:hypothetical protein